MATIIVDGWLRGHPIRKARKPHRCDYWRGASNGGKCKATIQVGDFYAEGEMNDSAGGFGRDRYCLTCAGYRADGHSLPEVAPLKLETA